MALPRISLVCFALAACSIPTKVAGTGDAAGSAGSDGGVPDDGMADVMFDAMVDAVPGAPTVTLTGMPDAVGNRSTVTFMYTASSPTMPVTIECRLDAQPYATCPATSKTFTGVPDGAHTFDLRATTMGKTGEIPSYAFAIDTAAPVLAITSQPAANSNAATAQFQFTIGDATTVTCKVDAQTAAPCTSPASYNGLADGAHTFVLQGVDAAGNVATRNSAWTIDTVAPVLAITMQPPAVSVVASAQLQFTATGATAVTCQLDNQPAAACTTSASYTGLADGAHTFTLKGSDAAGNVTTRTASWTIDTTPPALAITGEPADPSVMASAQFMFTIGDSVSVTCQLDAQTAVACTSPVAYTGLADGAHTFKLKGTDGAGNLATRTYTWTIDTTPPVLALTQTPAAIASTTTATFAFTVGDSASWTCQLDGTVPNACTSPTTYTGLGQGSHGFTLRGTDAAGNTATRSFTWSVDSVAPVVQITSGPGSPTTSKTATFGFTTNEGTTTCALDTGGFAACSSPTTYTGLADGLHFFSVKATDAAGNATTTPTYGWSIDTTPPSIGTISYTCDTAGALSVMWTVSDAVSGVATVSCTYAGAAVNCAQTSYSGGQNPSGSVFVVTATDHAGNASSKSRAINLGVICE